MDEQMREKFAERVNDAHGWQPPASPEECCLAESRDWAVWRESWQACAAALSQPAAQGDSSHPAGGECGGVPAPNMDLVNLARRAIDKHWDFETLKYGDDLYGKEHLADAVWNFVEECQSIGRTAFDNKYPEAA